MGAYKINVRGCLFARSFKTCPLISGHACLSAQYTGKTEKTMHAVVSQVDGQGCVEAALVVLWLSKN